MRWRLTCAKFFCTYPLVPEPRTEVRPIPLYMVSRASSKRTAQQQPGSLGSGFPKARGVVFWGVIMAAAPDDAAWQAYTKLAEMTVRLFYDPAEFYIMKALLHAPRQTTADGVSHPEFQLDDTIAQRLHLHATYVRKILANLHRDRLVICLPQDAPSSTCG